jgi:hypothetical protein
VIGCITFFRPILQNPSPEKWTIFPQVGDIHILEIGAGWDFLANFIYYCYGINRQTTVDIVSLATAEAVNAVITALQDRPPPGAIRQPQALVRDASLKEDLERLYGITYFAPMDVRVSGLPDQSIDAILTTSVLEHIPPTELHGIFGEFRRILNPEGLMRHRIDYSDHYSHSDQAISPYNMLRFGDRVWRWFSPPNHFQNRWKTPDYLRLFHATGFKVVRCDEVHGNPDLLAQIPLHGKFAGQHKDDLVKLSAAFELK